MESTVYSSRRLAIRFNRSTSSLSCSLKADLFSPTQR